MHYHWYEPDKTRDKSNISGFGIKLIEDVLVKLQIIEDDNWCGVEDIENVYDIDCRNPRVEVTVIIES